MQFGGGGVLANAELQILHITECRDALDEERSDIVRFSSGRIMTVRRYVFDPSAIEGAHYFKIPQMPGGPAFLSGAFVDRVRDVGLTGFNPQLVWESGASGNNAP